MEVVAIFSDAYIPVPTRFGPIPEFHRGSYPTLRNGEPHQMKIKLCQNEHFRWGRVYIYKLLPSVVKVETYYTLEYFNP